ncbi:hypothetical protein SKAU_G00104640 [Synaphobranchus kaupii]|uniref:Uncharacterized protein n=1 Tax=Synaphobranchus kaupii TaxID=118154 RepID=A0A9Q1FZ91_SYNKA|nr:hypothetical protein SKAU_G00104640 [Synaphobranchus kaupii]
MGLVYNNRVAKPAITHNYTAKTAVLPSAIDSSLRGSAVSSLPRGRETAPHTDGSIWKETGQQKQWSGLDWFGEALHTTQHCGRRPCGSAACTLRLRGADSCRESHGLRIEEEPDSE